MEDEQLGLFGGEDSTRATSPASGEQVQKIYVHFERPADVAEFARLVGQPVTMGTRAICYPAGDLNRVLEAAAHAPREKWEPNGDDVEDDDRPLRARDLQTNLFGDAEWWEEFWASMPEFDQKDLAPYHSVEVYLRNARDREAFAKLVDQTITPDGPRTRTRSIWFPEAEIGRFVDKCYVSKPPAGPFGPRYPIYIVSKGRWATRLTSKALHKLGVAHFIVVEEQELERYAAVVGPLATLLVLDRRYQREYDTFDDLGDTKGKGPGPARNFAWEHAIAAGAAWHWVMDDNIEGFFRLNRNLKTPVGDGTIFRAMEDFVDRYENVAMAGPNYFMFASRKTRMPPLTLNTRIYSCNLIRNSAPYRWRGRYNEDTDISLRMLKDGLVTVQFNAFLQFKLTTQTLGGGNTAEFYAKEGTLPKSEMLAKMHPDVARVVFKFGRWHHHVDYSGYRVNRPRLRPDVRLEPGVYDFGMVLEISGIPEGSAPIEPATPPVPVETTTPFVSPAAIADPIEFVGPPEPPRHPSIAWYAAEAARLRREGEESASRYWAERGKVWP